MQNLIDGDFASNNGGWQWSASTGTDPQPYFRIFNPYNQSEKVAFFFSFAVPKAESASAGRSRGKIYPALYTRTQEAERQRHVIVLSRCVRPLTLSYTEIHNPSKDAAEVHGYPKPIVEHTKETRDRAIRCYQSPGAE